jgi:hypothetical protein
VTHCSVSWYTAEASPALPGTNLPSLVTCSTKNVATHFLWRVSKTSALDLPPTTLDPKPSTLNPQPSTLNPQPSTLNPKPSTLSTQPSTLNPRHSTLDPQP